MMGYPGDFSPKTLEMLSIAEHIADGKQITITHIQEALNVITSGEAGSTIQKETSLQERDRQDS